MTANALANPLMRRRVAAALMGVSVSTVDRLVRAGELPAMRVGGSVRFALCDLEAYIQESESGSKAVTV
jgi:excisionase family DNA binding protein